MEKNFYYLCMTILLVYVCNFILTMDDITILPNGTYSHTFICDEKQVFLLLLLFGYGIFITIDYIKNKRKEKKNEH